MCDILEKDLLLLFYDIVYGIPLHSSVLTLPPLA